MALFNKKLLPKKSTSPSELEDMLNVMIRFGCPVQTVNAVLNLFQIIDQGAERHLRLYEEKYHTASPVHSHAPLSRKGR